MSVNSFMSEWVQAFIRQPPFVVLATSNASGHCDASPKGGKPGFVKVLDDRHLLIPDVAGNRLFQSYENVSSNPHVGLIFFIPGLDSTARVNGRVEIVDKAMLGAKRLSRPWDRELNRMRTLPCHAWVVAVEAQRLQ
jgi:predicted pyridoxine 5'-phosphate oxidase superfamily flavin-nucleotide-binding protein